MAVSVRGGRPTPAMTNSQVGLPPVGSTEDQHLKELVEDDPVRDARPVVDQRVTQALRGLGLARFDGSAPDLHVSRLRRRRAAVDRVSCSAGVGPWQLKGPTVTGGGRCPRGPRVTRPPRHKEAPRNIEWRVRWPEGPEGAVNPTPQSAPDAAGPRRRRDQATGRSASRRLVRWENHWKGRRRRRAPPRRVPGS
jgi:hypothetical protein